MAVIYKTKRSHTNMFYTNYIPAPNTLRDKSSWNKTYLGNKVSFILKRTKERGEENEGEGTEKEPSQPAAF